MQSALLFVILILTASSVIPRAAQGRPPSPASVARVEREWEQAQREYYEAVKAERSPTPERKRELESQILAPKRDALRRIRREVQLYQGPKPSPSPEGAQSPVGTEPAVSPTPSITPVIEFGRKRPASPPRPPKFKIDEVPKESTETEFR